MTTISFSARRFGVLLVLQPLPSDYNILRVFILMENNATNASKLLNALDADIRTQSSPVATPKRTPLQDSNNPQLSSSKLKEKQAQSVELARAIQAKGASVSKASELRSPPVLRYTPSHNILQRPMHSFCLAH